jgi:RimJ/RimL family protein N-acetyltransferase
MRNPYLVGTKVYLRPLEEDDAAVCHPWLNDPDVWRTLALRGRPNTEARSRAYIRGLDPAHDQVFAIVTRDGEEYVGNCGLHAIEPIDRHATLGIVIGRKDCWGRGFGTEAVSLLCHHAFETLNLHKVCLSTYAGNERALRAYARVGFQVEGRRRAQVFVEGRWLDEIVLGLLAGELAARR